MIVGPIASGKTTVARGLAARLRAGGRRIALVELDDIVKMMGGFAGLSKESFGAAQIANGRLIGAWLEHGVTVVAPGPFYDADEVNALVAFVPVGTTVRWIQLRASLESTVSRAMSDADRLISRQREFLVAAHARAVALLAQRPPPDWSFDTEVMTADDIAERLAVAIGTKPS